MTTAATTSSGLQFYQRSAVHLNNLGVDFLRSGSHQQAWVILQDATTIMKASFPVIKELLLHGACLSQQDVEEMMRRANRHQGSRFRPNTQQTATVLPPNVQVIRIEDTHQMSYAQDGTIGYTDDMKVQAAIILYNFGVVSLVGITQSSTALRSPLSPSDRFILDNALYLFEAATRVLQTAQMSSLDAKGMPAATDFINLHQLTSIELRILVGLATAVRLSPRGTTSLYEIASLFERIKNTQEYIACLDKFLRDCYPTMESASHLAASA